MVRPSAVFTGQMTLFKRALLPALFLVALPAPGPAAARQSFLDVFTQADSALVGPILDRATYRDFSVGTGLSAAGAGDVNGDGRGDVIVGQPGAPTAEGQPGGMAYVAFGTPPLGTFELADLGARGFRVHGAEEDTWTGSVVDRAGDFNGDGIGDVLVAAPGAANGRGAVYVVFGSTTPRDVDLRMLGDRGVQIAGTTEADEDDGTCDSGCNLYSGDQVGTDVAPAGDVNGDGLADVVVGAGGLDQVAVVFGRRSAGQVSFDRPDPGFLIREVSADSPADSDYMPVAGPGDVNGDGLADLLIGADPTWGGECGRCPGNAYLVFGKRSASPVRIGHLGTRGLRILGHGRREGMGFDVAGPGDVNGDRRPDLLIGTGRRAVVVFGSRRSGVLRTERLRGRGFELRGTNVAQVDRAGDWNRDGLADLAVNRHVVFGRRSTRPVSLARTFGGFRLTNTGYCLMSDRLCPAYRERNYQLSGAGDLNGDGREDLVYGDAAAGPRERGAAFVVSRTAPPRAAVVPGWRYGAVGVGAARSVRLRVLCPVNAFRSCAGTVRLITRSGAQRLLAPRRFQAPAGGFAVVRGNLPAAVGRRLRRRGEVEATARVDAVDPRGRRAATSVDVLLKPRQLISRSRPPYVP